MAREEVWRWSIALLFVAGCSDRRPDENVENLSENLLVGSEAEPNGAVAQATPLAVPKDVVIGNIMPRGDVDYYSFTGVAGERIFAATQTATSPIPQPDTVLTLLGIDGTTEIETDDDNGVYTSQSSSISGAVLPAAGTYYLRVSHYDPAHELRPYRLHFQKRNGVPQSEVEPNETPQTLSTLAGAGAWVAGTVSTVEDIDYYFVELNAGDTIFASLDVDPERDGTNFNSYIAGGLFSGGYFAWDDSGTESGPDSEAFFTTVQTAGTYGIRVGTGTASATTNYVLSITAHPGANKLSCATYTSTKTIEIPPGPGTTLARLDVPDDIIIGDVDVNLDLDHLSSADLDVHLISPAGGRTGLFTDVAVMRPPFSFTLDDEAGIPANVNWLSLHNMRVQPESAYRLSWFDGERTRGTWTLEIRDDQADNGGTLTAWGITVCPAATAPACESRYAPRVVYSADFETNDGGFTHAGAADEWARGTPSAEPIATCNGGTRCFKTDLTGTYEASSNQDLVSPPIDLTDVVAPVRVRWAQKLQMENASADHAWAEVRNVDDTNPRRIYEFLDGTMTDVIGEPPETVNESAGWSILEADIGAYAGGSIELVFHVDSDATTHLAGLAIDDVSVTSGCVLTCGNGSPDSGETCDDGNITSGDGCDANCTPTGCGNGVPTAGEGCDDGNLMTGDGCDGTCQIENAGGTGGAGAAGTGGGGGVGTGGTSGGGGPPLGGVGGVAGASGAGTAGVSGTAGGGMGGVAGSSGTSAGSSGTNAGEGGYAGEAGTGGDAGATDGGAGETGRSGDAGATDGEAGEAPGGNAGRSSGAGAGGDSDHNKPGGGDSAEDSGCGCRVAGKHERFGSWLFAGLVVGAAFFRWRRSGPVSMGGARTSFSQPSQAGRA